MSRLIEIYGQNVPDAFRESIWKIRHFARPQKTRNGPAWAMPAPTYLSIARPYERVLTCPKRDANPFFHVMEFIWMMSGSDKLQWIEQFNKRMREYSDDGKTLHAAYGHRWRKEWGIDQIQAAINMLLRNREDRRIVLTMWNPMLDLGINCKDLPCNTQIMLRVTNEHMLDFLVTNRSNDLIWGMLGANAVHMTMLQELIAQAAGLAVGDYNVISNNLHIYEDVPHFDYYMNHYPQREDVYTRPGPLPARVPLLQSNETYEDFVTDCKNFIEDSSNKLKTFWMEHVGAAMYDVWMLRKAGKTYDTKYILADDWRIACEEWIGRRNTTLADQRSDNHPSVVGGEQKSQSVDSSPVQSIYMAGVDTAEFELGLAPVEPNLDSNVSS